MTNNNYKKGFTLIELLVVISIVALLSSVVLASLSTARSRAADTAIKADLKGIATSAEVEALNMNGKYNTTGIAVTSSTCSTLGGEEVTGTILQNPNINGGIKHIVATNGRQDVYCNISADGESYGIIAPLSVATGDSVYMDSSGNFFAGESDTTIILSLRTYVMNNICSSRLRTCNPNLDFNGDSNISSADNLILARLPLQTLAIFNNVYNGITAEVSSKFGTNNNYFDTNRNGNVDSLDLNRIQAALMSERY